MTQKKIDYSDVMSLGFKRTEGYDEVWKDEFGYEYFIVEMKLGKRFLATWNIETHVVEINRTNPSGTIVGRLPVEDLEHLKMYIGLFKEIIEPPQYDYQHVA